MMSIFYRVPYQKIKLVESYRLHSCRSVVLGLFLLAFGISDLHASHKSTGLRLSLGPELYHVSRFREGGTKQHGWLFGGRFICDHVRRYTFYWGIEAASAGGTLYGTSGKGAFLKSHMCDRSIESRLGYTFQKKQGHRFAFTPFVGAGYYIENNNFKRPSQLPLHFKTTYRYVTAGFISSAYITPNLSVGVNLKLRHMLDPECKITHDPARGSAYLKIANETVQYRVEMPISYLPCSPYSLTAMPFFEMRNYGRRVSYPFDFLRTRYYNYGVTLQLVLLFTP